MWFCVNECFSRTNEWANEICPDWNSIWIYVKQCLPTHRVGFLGWECNENRNRIVAGECLFDLSHCHPTTTTNIMIDGFLWSLKLGNGNRIRTITGFVYHEDWFYLATLRQGLAFRFCEKVWCIVKHWHIALQYWSDLWKNQLRPFRSITSAFDATIWSN